MKNEEFAKQIGTNLRKIRTDRNISRETVAQQLGVTAQTISKFETGQTDTSVTRLQQLAEVYNVHPSEIFAENSPISAKVEGIREEMKYYQKKYEKAQEKIIELQGIITNKERESKYKKS